MFVGCACANDPQRAHCNYARRPCTSRRCFLNFMGFRTKFNIALHRLVAIHREHLSTCVNHMKRGDGGGGGGCRDIHRDEHQRTSYDGGGGGMHISAKCAPY